MDPTGFYALQSSGDLKPLTFRFTFDAPREFIIAQNEYLADIEFNGFTLPSGSWHLLSASNTNTSGTGSEIGFSGVNGAPPYGNYSIDGGGSFFDFQITNSPGYPEYGSAITVNVVSDVPEPSCAVLLLSGGLLCFRRRAPHTGKTSLEVGHQPLLHPWLSPMACRDVDPV